MDVYLSVVEAAGRLRISRSKMYKMLASGEIPSYTVAGSKILVKEQDLDGAIKLNVTDDMRATMLADKICREYKQGKPRRERR